MQIRGLAAATLRNAAVVAIVLSLIPPRCQAATPQQNASVVAQTREELERQKLVLEVRKLENEQEYDDWLKWGVPVSTVVLSILTLVGTFLVARWTRANALDQATHEKRLECYPKLVSSSSRLALYFPNENRLGDGTLTPADCSIIGREMSDWYFGGGGLLLSTQARDSYFRLARALTRATSAKTLCVPKFPDDAKDVSKEKVDDYRKTLGIRAPIKVGYIDEWRFGPLALQSDPEESKPHRVFKDYLLLQALSSDLRTKLTQDLRSRRRPT